MTTFVFLFGYHICRCSCMLFFFLLRFFDFKLEQNSIAFGDVQNGIKINKINKKYAHTQQFDVQRRIWLRFCVFIRSTAEISFHILASLLDTIRLIAMNTMANEIGSEKENMHLIHTRQIWPFTWSFLVANTVPRHLMCRYVAYLVIVSLSLSCARISVYLTLWLSSLLHSKYMYAHTICRCFASYSSNSNNNNSSSIEHE